MDRGSNDAAAGLSDVIVVWTTLGLDAVAIYRLYARWATPPGMPARPPGRAGGIRQVMIFGRHPALPVAIATVPIATGRLNGPERGVVAGGGALIGGVVGALVACLDRDRVSSAVGDAVAAGGVAGALAVTLGAAGRAGVGPVRPRSAGDRARLALGMGLVLHGLPWILADLGVYAGDVPALGRVFLSRQTPPGGGVPAVHLGHHHGMDGTLLALAALTLSRALPEVRPAPVREALSTYLATLLVYGSMRAVEDGWNEQIVKRGWASRRIPPVVAGGRPVRPWMWAGMFGGATVVHRIWFRRTNPDTPASSVRPPSPPATGVRGAGGVRGPYRCPPAPARRPG